MHQAERARCIRIEQFFIEGPDLTGQQQAFIDNGARRKRRNVEETFVAYVRVSDGRFGAFTNQVKPALKSVLIEVRWAADKKLLDIGLRCTGDPAYCVHRQRCIAPAEHGQAFLASDLLKESLARKALLAIHRQKTHRDAVLSGFGQGKAQIVRFTREETMRNLDQNAGAIARFRIASASAPVDEILQNLQTLQHNVVRGLPVDVDYKT